MDQLHSIWEEIGIVDEQRKARLDVVFLHLRNLLEEMVREETALRTRLQKNTETYSEDLLRLCNELGHPPYEVEYN